MVDEQLPLQRKILKGQVDVHNEETHWFSVRTAGKKSAAVFVSSLFYCHILPTVDGRFRGVRVSILTRSKLEGLCFYDGHKSEVQVFLSVYYIKFAISQ